MTINAVVYFKHKDYEFKKVCDSLKIVRLYFEDKLKIKLKLKRVKSENITVHFGDEIISENVYKLETYISIINFILEQKKEIRKCGQETK